MSTTELFYQASALRPNVPNGENFFVTVVQGYSSTDNPPLPPALIDALVPFCKQFYDLPEIAKPPPPPAPCAPDSIAAVRYRDALRLYIHRFIDPDAALKCYLAVFLDLMTNIMSHLPKALHGNWNDIETKRTLFSVPLTLFIENPRQLVLDMVAPFERDEIEKLRLFRPLYEKITKNFQDKTKDEDPITTLLKGTPFIPLLTWTQLPLNIPLSTWGNHAIIAAPSGHGKTQTLGALIQHFLELEDPPGLFVIEPHDDLINKLQQLDVFHPTHGRLKDRLVVIDPADTPQLNFLDVGPEISANITDNFKYLMSSLSTELTRKQETAATYILLLTRQIPGATIETLREIMEDRTKSLANSKFAPYIRKLEPFAQDFFEKQFYSNNMSETRQQVAQRLYTVLANDAFRKMFGAAKNSFNTFDAMQSKKIVLVNSSRETLQKDGSSIFGRWMLTQIMGAAFARPKHERPLCLVVLDEAHQYFDTSTETILSELRKFGVGLIAATQFLDQIDDRTKASIYGNTAIKLAGPVSHKDATSLSQEMFCKAEFIRASRSVDRSHAEFALYAKTLAKAVKVTIPFGTLENAPKMSHEAYRTMRQKNKERYGTHEAPTSPNVEASRAETVLPAYADTTTVAPSPKATTAPPKKIVPDDAKKWFKP